MTGLWFVAGSLVNVVNYWMQFQAVNSLHPGTPQVVVRRIVGGAILRWMMTAVLLLAAFNQGVIPGLLTLTGYWIIRLVMIYRWNLS